MGDDSKLKQQSVVKGFAVLTVSMVLVKVLSLLYVPVLRKILGEVGLGVYYSAYSIFAYVYILANAGIPVAISKMVAEFVAVENYKDAVKTFKIARTMLIGFGAVISIFMYVFATPLSKMLESTESVLAIKALSPTIFITTILCAYKGYFQGRSNMTPTAVSQVLEQIFNIIFSLLFALLLISFGDRYGAAGGTIGTSLGALVAAVYLIFIYKKGKTIDFPKTSNETVVKRVPTKVIANMILAYAIPMTIGVALQNAGMIVDLKIVKERLLFSGLDTNAVDTLWGILSQYNTLVSVPMALIGSLSISILPIISRHNAVADKKSLKVSVNSTYRVTYIIAAPCAFGLAALSSQILTLIGYDVEAARLLVYGAFVLILTAISLVQTSILQGLGKVNMVTVYSLLGLLGKILVNYIFVAIPTINILGAVLGNGVAFLIMTLLSQTLINKTLKLKIRLVRPCIKPVFASIIMAMVTMLTYTISSFLFSIVLSGYILNALSTLFAIPVAVVIYIVTLITIGGIRKADLDSLPRKIVRFIPGNLILKLK
ncbi:polysaccharide biosynthesis protein [Clostridium sp.]|uniref:putative polysaccharide biosynthesis protein n=1 Tax=Clostridium sp. TaxID=1506 RepID=UPI002FCBF80C